MCVCAHERGTADALEYFQLNSFQSGDSSRGSSPAPATLHLGGLVGCSTLVSHPSFSLTWTSTSQHRALRK